MKKHILMIAVCLMAAACTKDLDQKPHVEVSGDDVYSSIDGFTAMMGKVYSSMVVADYTLSSTNGYDYMRCLINLQECGTDEMASTWLSGDNTYDITYLSWDADDIWVSDMYYCMFHNIAVCNDLIKNCTQEREASLGEEVGRYRAEARFMRALFYAHAMDLFGAVPFVDENTAIGSDVPPRYTRSQIFDFVESELLDCVDDMYTASQCPYGRASQGAAYTLLAKIYLNSEVYTGTARYSECLEACTKAIAQGYSLHKDYAKLFNADNNLRTDEIIFALPVGVETISWGATTYLICGEVGNDSSQDPASYGIAVGWGMFRIRGEIPAKFESGDSRAMFYTDGQDQWLEKIDDQSCGYFTEKWSNLTDSGETASLTTTYGCCTDFPLFRLADVYLMYAEAKLRGASGGSMSQALSYVNMVRERAFGGSEGDITEGELTLSFLIDERARELLLETHRRTDLIRFGMFTTSDYLWQWKGGVKDGKAVDDKFNIYPIPTTELTANPNMYNENY